VRFEVVSIESGVDDDEVLIAYEADSQVYESGRMLRVVYRRNETWPDAIENHLITLDHEDKECAVLEVLDTVLPTISQFYNTVTRITLKTVQEKLTADISEDLVEIIPVPAQLSHIPTVLIHELQRARSMAMNVDYVSWKGQNFVFKKEGGESLEGTIQEITILDKLRDSQYVIDLTAMVINKDNGIRGFLMPYMPAGDLPHVFREGRRSQGRADDDESEPVFDWSLKLSWACQVTQSVIDLHANAFYNGDLKPTNVLLNSLGQAILIDFLSIGITDEFAAPELLEKFHHYTDHTLLQSALTASADIYSLGLLLYAIALEKTSGTIQPLEYGRVPTWYQNVVERCIVQNPVDRPSATQVLRLLSKGA
jgi:serine/threonine protein kinase